MCLFCKPVALVGAGGEVVNNSVNVKLHRVLLCTRNIRGRDVNVDVSKDVKERLFFKMYC